MAISKVVLVGAGGNLGPHILSALLDAGFSVTVLSRQSSTSTFPTGVHVEHIADDYPLDQLTSIFKGQDAVVSTISFFSLAQQKTMIDAAVAAGVQRFLPAEFGSDPPEEVKAANVVWAGKSEQIKYLKSQESKGLTWTGVANGLFFNWGLEKNFFRLDAKAKTAVLGDDGNHKFPTSTWKTIGAATAGVLKNPEQTKNRFVHVETFHISQNDLLAELEKLTGTKFTKQTLDLKSYIEEQEKAAKAGDKWALYNVIWAHAVAEQDWEKEFGLDNELLGVPKENFSAVVARIFKEMQG